ncbi:cadmium resistance transporter, partial [Micromonospora coerulea]|uniref:cadmium resistance transporter n=1 Tax=Micromonospora coerulea TaxID=47856 RepID=UPI003D155F51
MATGLVSMAAVTIANGADNVSVYTPVFRTIGLTNTLITLAVFAIGVSLSGASPAPGWARTGRVPMVPRSMGPGL